MTDIGVACNCHPTFGQFCVFEIGQDVQPYPQADPDEPIFFIPSEFNLPSFDQCPVGKEDFPCEEIDYYDNSYGQFPAKYRVGTTDY